MTVSKELLQDLKIISMNIQFFDKEAYLETNEYEFNSISCVLTKFDNKKLFFKLLENKKICTEDVYLQISIQEDDISYISENQKINIIENGTDYAVATISTEYSEPTGTIKKLLDLLSFLNCQDEKYGRRKEPRIKIGKERSLQFGLSSPEQKIFSKTARIIQPCAIVDASIHGICIITPFENPAFKNLENFSIYLSFTKPEQTVILQAHKVHSKLTETQNKIFSTISCQLLEPVHYAWKERVIKMLENAGPGN